ncbi:transporter substrate-binding domain-containing protein [Candidatus Gracilibacteria bacterium]|nr:transporter substrate-binding domain-containing protein [Candidatus Gracilibacteria bacterium]
MKKTFLLLPLLFFGLVSAQEGVQPVEDLRQKKVLEIATKPIEPFVMTDSNEGFSMDLLKALMEKIDYPYSINRYKTVGEILSAVQTGGADIAMAAITINAEREEKVDFSQPMFDAGLQIMVSATKEVGKFHIGLLFPLLKVIIVLAVMMFISGNLVWWSEHQTNPQFDHSYWKGVWDGFWWSAVTVTTVGYGDKAPQKMLGKLIGIIWMFAGMFIIAYFTSSITSTLTVQSIRGSIESPADLPGKRIGSVQETAPAKYIMEALKLEPVLYPSLDEMYEALKNDQIDAVVYDAPVLQYYATNKSNGVLKVVGEPFKKEYYGIAFPKGSEFLDMIDVALLRLVEDGTYQQIREKWFGK